MSEQNTTTENYGETFTVGRCWIANPRWSREVEGSEPPGVMLFGVMHGDTLVFGAKPENFTNDIYSFGRWVSQQPLLDGEVAR